MIVQKRHYLADMASARELLRGAAQLLEDTPMPDSVLRSLEFVRGAVDARLEGELPEGE